MDLRDAVRDRLREDKIKLWLPPYDTPDAIDALAINYSEVLEVPDAEVLPHLEALRRSALDKLAARTLITLQGTGFSVKVSTELSGAVARAAVAAALGHDVRRHHVRIVGGGRALRDAETLREQGWPAGEALRCVVACTPRTEGVVDPDAVAAHERQRVLEACDVLANDQHFSLSDGGSGRRVSVHQAARAPLVREEPCAATRAGGRDATALASLVSVGAEVGQAEDALRATGGNVDAAATRLLEAPPHPSQPQPPPPPPDLPTDDEDRDAALAAARALVERELRGALAGADADAEEGCDLRFERRLLDMLISGQ